MERHGDRDGLRQSLDLVLALESRLEQILSQVLAETKGYLEAPSVIGRLESLVTGHWEALQNHLQGLGDTDVAPLGSGISMAFEASSETPKDAQGQDAIEGLRALATAFTETAIAYAVLHALAHRSYYVPTADLADEHRRSYLAAAHGIHRAVADVAIQELENAGHTCRCQCPSCAPGICLCWHAHVDADVTGPETPQHGVVVRTPRPESSADRAGLRRGDVILAVGDREVRSYQDMLDGMREHEPGQYIRLRVLRGTDDMQLNVTR